MGGKAARRRRQTNGDDEIAGFESGFTLGRVAGQAMQLVERDLATTVPTLDLDDGVKRDQRHAEIGRVRSDAALAPAEHGVAAVLAIAGIAAGPGLALV